MTLTIHILVFLFGAAIGSFLNVCIYRMEEGKSIVWPRSYCPFCRAPIRGYDNIPLLSYVLLKGKCRTCGGSISVRYPIVEGLTALIYLLLFRHHGLSVDFLALLVFASVSFYAVAVTGYGQEEDRRQAKEAGFDFHLTKPLDQAQVLDLMTRMPRF